MTIEDILRDKVKHMPLETRREYLLTKVEFSKPNEAITAYILAKEHKLIRKIDAVYLYKYTPYNLIAKDIQTDMECGVYDIKRRIR